MVPKNGKQSVQELLTCKNPSFTFYYMIILFPSTVNQTLLPTSVLKRQANNVTVKVKFSVFRTISDICEFNFIPWERVIFFYMGSLSQKGRATPTIYSRLADELLSNDILVEISLLKTTSVSFPFSSFLFRSQYQHSVPSSIYGHLLQYYTGFQLTWPKTM